MTAVFENISKTLGKINILISNAGILGNTHPISTSHLDEFWHVFETNTKGPLIALQSFLRFAAPDAVVINVSSGIGHIPAIPTRGTESPEMHVVNLQPAVVKTGIQERERESAEVPTGFVFTDTVDLAAHFMVWLTSPEAKFLKGKYVWSNWDVDEVIERKEEIENSNLLTMGLEGWPFDKFLKG